MKKMLTFVPLLVWLVFGSIASFASKPALVHTVSSVKKSRQTPPLTLEHMRKIYKPSYRSLHPKVPLLTDRSESVLERDQPLSLMKSCGACHDTAYIAEHNYHAKVGLDDRQLIASGSSGRAWDIGPGLFGRWDPFTYRRLSRIGDDKLDLGTAEWIQVMGARHVGGGPAAVSRKDLRSLVEVRPSDVVDSETHVLDPVSTKPRYWDWNRSGAVELNCLLCHMRNPNNRQRVSSLKRGDFKWASTATLLGSGVVKKSQQGYQWNRKAFDTEGAVSVQKLQIFDPPSANCRLCHGKACKCTDPVVFENSLNNWSVETTGTVFSPERMCDSGMNLSGKNNLFSPWDVHAERLLNCKDCHHSPNNPAYNRKESPDKDADHLAFDARKLGVGAYLQRPDHNLVKGHTAQGTLARRFDGTMRGCRDCHQAEAVHDFLPYKKMHFDRVSCQTCHVPKVFAPVRKSTDWTLLTSEGAPLVSHRGVRGPINDPLSLIEGYQPILLLHQDENDVNRLGPHNIVSSWFWVEGELGRPVRYLDLVRALFEKPGVYHPQVIEALDENANGNLEPGELKLNAKQKVQIIADRLGSVSVIRPRIRAEMQPYTISHGMLSVDFASRCCQCCHSSTSRITEPFALADSVPGGVLPEMVKDSTCALVGTTEVDERGRLFFKPSIDPNRLYIHGIHRMEWTDVVGIFVFLATLVGVVLHGGLRLFTVKKRSERGQAR